MQNSSVSTCFTSLPVSQLTTTLTENQFQIKSPNYSKTGGTNTTPHMVAHHAEFQLWILIYRSISEVGFKQCKTTRESTSHYPLVTTIMCFMLRGGGTRNDVCQATARCFIFPGMGTECFNVCNQSCSIPALIGLLTWVTPASYRGLYIALLHQDHARSSQCWAHIICDAYHNISCDSHAHLFRETRLCDH